MANQGSFSFEIEPSNGILLNQFAGYFDAEQVELYVAELQLRAAESRGRFGKLRLLVDAIKADVQSPELVQKLSSIADQVLTSPSDRMATVITSTLHKLQAQRAIPYAAAQVFFSLTHARSWLISENINPTI